MKKLLVILILGLAFGQFGYSQTTAKRLSTETHFFWTISADTMQVTRLDKVVNISIYNPSYATDSVTINGCTAIIDGITTNGIKIPPGEASVSIGFDYAFIDSINIAVPGVAWVEILQKRD